MKYNIRLATIDDCNELSKLKIEVWKTTYKGIYSDEKLNNYDIAKNAEKFARTVQNEDIKLYVVENDENKIIGYMSCGKPFREFENYNQEIGLLYILKEYQKMGIGKKLFELGYNEIKKSGYKNFFISCNKYNTNAQKFYEKMGGTIVHIDEDKEDKSESQIKYHYDII